MPRPQVIAYVALGANLGDAQATVLAAMKTVAALPDTCLLRASSLYRSAPYEANGPDFINAVIAIQTRLDGREMLFKLQHIEQAQGRLRPFKNAPRTLDLDILLYGDSVIATSDLRVPHPRMWERAFVFLPLSEIAPRLVTPAQLAQVAHQAIERLDGHPARLT